MIEEFRHDLLRTFAGRPVYEFALENREQITPGAVPDRPEDWAWRISAGYPDEPGFAAALELFFEAVDPARVRALIVGVWYTDDDPTGPSDEAIHLLVQNAERLPALEALFLGDVDRDRSEVSWLHQDDPGKLFTAFPRLREFGLRGTSELSLAPIAHDVLEELTFQGGGLPPEVARAVGRSRLPALTGLDLYLGTPDYNGGAEVADLAPILDGTAFPRLRHLGLRDAENADEIAAGLAHAPVLAQLESLDLSLGTLTDQGAAALLSGQPLTHLARLDLHHHYLSEEMMQRVWAALPQVAVNMDEQVESDVVQEDWADPDDPDLQPTVWRYVAVAE